MLAAGTCVSSKDTAAAAAVGGGVTRLCAAAIALEKEVTENIQLSTVSNAWVVYYKEVKTQKSDQGLDQTRCDFGISW